MLSESDVGMESHGEDNVLLHAGMCYGLAYVLQSYVIAQLPVPQKYDVFLMK